MNSVFCLTIRFLDPVPQFHGRGSDGNPEWPPSPLRMFQALVAAAATRWRESLFQDFARPALQWLEAIRPAVVTPQVPAESFGYRMYVPNNSGDLMTAAWAHGNTETSMAKFRVEKDVRPTHLAGEAVHYLYSITDAAEFAKHKQILTDAVRSVTHLGWGVDMVAGNAELLSDEQAAKLVGERWQPTPGPTDTQLRVPRAGTLAALMDKHTAFLNRLSADGFKPVPPLTAFGVVGYRRDTDLAERPVAVFEIHKTVAELAELDSGRSKFVAFDPLRTPRFARTGGTHDPCGAVVVAGLVRCATAKAARDQGWAESRIESFVQGHGDQKNGQATTDDRLMYLPLPSITPLKVDAIRRVMLVGPAGSEADLARLRQVLNGRELFAEGREQPVAMLSVGSSSDKTVVPYRRESCVWSTVTPVVLPGFDDPTGIRRRLSNRNPAAPMNAEVKLRQLTMLNQQTRDLLLRAFEHAGIGPGLLSAELLDRGEAELDWRDVGFRAGLDLARHYQLGTAPYPRYHVRVRFARPVRGPLAVGTGRYRGLGLFATDGD